MKVIETEAVAPQPLRIEGVKSDAKEVFLWDEEGNFIGTEWRMTDAAKSEADIEPNNEVDPTG